MKKFLKHNFGRIIIRCLKLILVRNPQMIWKLKNLNSNEKAYVMKEEVDKVSQYHKGDLLSICVLPEYRGTGVAHELVDEFLNTLKSKERKYCLLTVKVNNKRGVKFYEKNGFEKYIIKADTIAYIKVL